MRISNNQINPNDPFHLLSLQACRSQESSSSRKNQELQSEAKEKAEKLFKKYWSPSDNTATGHILQKFSEKEINEILDKHVNFYDNWDAFCVKKKALTDSYTENQEVYGCLMASITSALAEQINQKRSFSDLVDFACFGRQLISSFSEHISIAQIRDYGAPRDIYIFTYLNKAYADLGKRLLELNWDHESPLTVINICPEGGEGVVSIYGIIPNGVIDQPEDKILLSAIFLNDRVHHCYPRNIPKGMQYVEKIFTDSLVLEGDALYQKLGEFFWWWCQVKPVIAGDPSIGELLFKAILLSKNDQIRGWKPGIVPWEETIVEYDSNRFGKNFTLLWE